VSADTAPGAIPAERLEQYRRELVGYCYRMLGSIYEAEDAVQDTMLRAWRALATFEDRTGLRPWLYRIATNVCIDMLKGRSRRALPTDVAPVATGELRRGGPRPEATWIQPAPDSLILPPDGDPAERAVSRESVRLAFIAALQHLAPRQRAVLILRDVLRWRAAEVAVLLETSTDAVNSALRRARAALAAIDRDSAPSQPSPGDRELLAAYIDAFERNDVDALVGLLRDDAILEMPPFELCFWFTNDVACNLDKPSDLRAAVVPLPDQAGAYRRHAADRDVDDVGVPPVPRERWRGGVHDGAAGHHQQQLGRVVGDLTRTPDRAPRGRGAGDEGVGELGRGAGDRFEGSDLIVGDLLDRDLALGGERVGATDRQDARLAGKDRPDDDVGLAKRQARCHQIDLAATQWAERIGPLHLRHLDDAAGIGRLKGLDDGDHPR
jgi:RNA polymerase sigma-70 factor, ECF subfamily